MSHPEPAHHGARAGVVLHDLLEAELVERERRRNASGLRRDPSPTLIAPAAIGVAAVNGVSPAGAA